MDWVSNAGSVLSLVALVIASLGVGYGALNRTTISTLKDSNAAQAERIGILEDESAREKAENKRLTVENGMLRSIVTGTEQLVEIRTELSQHHADATTWWTGATETLQAIRATLENS